MKYDFGSLNWARFDDDTFGFLWLDDFLYLITAVGSHLLIFFSSLPLVCRPCVSLHRTANFETQSICELQSKKPDFSTAQAHSREPAGAGALKWMTNRSEDWVSRARREPSNCLKGKGEILAFERPQKEGIGEKMNPPMGIFITNDTQRSLSIPPTSHNQDFRTWCYLFSRWSEECCALSLSPCSRFFFPIENRNKSLVRLLSVLMSNVQRIQSRLALTLNPNSPGFLHLESIKASHYLISSAAYLAGRVMSRRFNLPTSNVRVRKVRFIFAS